MPVLPDTTPILWSLFFDAIFYVTMNAGVILFSVIGLVRIYTNHPSWSWFKAGVFFQALVMLGQGVGISRGQDVTGNLISIAVSAVVIAGFRYLTQKAMNKKK